MKPPRVFSGVFKKAVMRRGIPEKLYTDRGKIFTCTHVGQVCANLSTTLLKAKPYHSWSKGEIECLFYKRIERRVRKDATISVDSCLWEAPTHLRGVKVQVRYDPFISNKALEIYLGGKCVATARPCDKNYNAHHFKTSNYEYR